MNFEAALDYLKSGGVVSRSNWNGPHQWLYLVNETETFGSFIAIHPTSGKDRPWLASQSDLLANDWNLYPKSEPVAV